MGEGKEKKELGARRRQTNLAPLGKLSLSLSLFFLFFSKETYPRPAASIPVPSASIGVPRGGRVWRVVSLHRFSKIRKRQGERENKGRRENAPLRPTEEKKEREEVSFSSFSESKRERELIFFFAFL